MVAIFLNTQVDGSILTEEEVNAALHKASPQLAQEELQRVRDRTPYRIGALRSAANAKGYPNPNSRNLAKVWYDDEPQMFEWNRVYVAYQEGPPLGLPTYTNGPRQMLYQANTVDTPDIQAWADEVVAQAEADSQMNTFLGNLETFIATYFAQNPNGGDMP